MNCQEYLQHLQDQWDRRLPVQSPEIDTHLAQCPACRERLGAALRLDRGLRLLPIPAPSPELRDRLVASLLEETRRPPRLRRSWSRPLFLGLATAAGVLVAFLILARKPEPVVVGPVPPTVKPATPSVNENIAEATSAVTALTRRTATETVESSRMLLSELALPTNEPAVLGGAIVPPTAPLRDVGQNVTTGLEPVTSSARQAVNLFLRDLVPSAGEPKPGT